MVVPFVHGSIAWWMGNSNEQSNMYDWKGTGGVDRISGSLPPRREWRGLVHLHQERHLHPARQLSAKPARCANPEIVIV